MPKKLQNQTSTNAQQQAQQELSLSQIVGKGYRDYWRFRGRYRVCKGSRASKKSKTTALNFIVGLIQHPKANLLVIRKTFRTLKDSCFTELKWAMIRLGVVEHFHITESPLEMVYKPTGQKIYFRGLDDPLKVTSITVDIGHLCWCWMEEAYEISKETDFNMLDESIRGAVSDGLYKQITITFNPWNEHHWLKKRFFDVQDPDIFALTTNYLCNEWLDDADLKVFETMKTQNPRRYQVAGLGNWGIVDGLVYENWEERSFDLHDLTGKGLDALFGLDFGYTNDPSAFFCGMYDASRLELWVFDEFYESGLLNREIHDKIVALGYGKEVITADSSEPKSIADLRQLGLHRVRPSIKGPDSIRKGVDFIQGLKIYVHPHCVNFLREISSYTWQEDKFGKKINKPVDEENHLMDAMRYALEQKMRGATFRFC